MPATSLSGDCFLRRSSIGRAGSPSKSISTKSSPPSGDFASAVRKVWPR